MSCLQNHEIGLYYARSVMLMVPHPDNISPKRPPECVPQPVAFSGVKDSVTKADSCRAIFGSPRMLCSGETGGLRMRNIFKLCLLVLTVAACLESAKAQEVPPGTYRETCVNIR